MGGGGQFYAGQLSSVAVAPKGNYPGEGFSSGAIVLEQYKLYVSLTGFIFVFFVKVRNPIGWKQEILLI